MLAAILVLLAGISASGGAHAQISAGGGIFGTYDLRTNTETRVLEVVAAPAGGNNAFTGWVSRPGVRRDITGYFASIARRAVWVEDDFWLEPRIYVASTAQFSMTGVYYALTTGSGATDARNVFAFAARSQSGLQQDPVRQGRLTEPPSPPGIALADPAGAWWVNANGYEGALVLNVGADGDLTGFLFGDEIRGHLASAAGTLAFLRMRDYFTPLQFYQGHFLPAASPRRITGTFYPLSEAQGASPGRLEFPVEATGVAAFVRYRSRLTNQCLLLTYPVPNWDIRLSPCVGRDTEATLLRAPGAYYGDPRGATYMVFRLGGLCLDVYDPRTHAVSTAPGASIRPVACNRGASQRLRLSGLPAGNGFQIILTHGGPGAALCISADRSGGVRQELCGDPARPETIFDALP